MPKQIRRPELRSVENKAQQKERARCIQIARSFISWLPAGKAGRIVANAIADAIADDKNI